MRPLSFVVQPEQAGRSVGSLMASALGMSSSHISRLKRRRNGILLNGQPAYTTARVQAGDVLTAAIGDAPPLSRPEPMEFPLSVVYEDEFLLVLNKPAGLSVHASTRHPDEITLENALSAYLPEDCGMHPVSRLDKGTTGLMTVAKSGYVHTLLKRLQHTPAMAKTYLAVTVRPPEPPDGRIDAPIGYAEGSRYKMGVAENGAPSVTNYETVGSVHDLTLVRVRPETGRTHQIRVHMAYIGCPLFGDWLYGTEDARLARPALHAASLYFTHPLTGEKLSLAAPLPGDMASLLGRKLTEGAQ